MPEPVTPPEPRQKRYLVEMVESAFGEAIVSGQIPPGERITAEDLPEPLRSVSRTILREAMRQLAVRGLVRPIKRRGTIATAPEQWTMLDPRVLGWFSRTGRAAELVAELRAIRQMIEPFAAQLAARQGSREHVAEIRAAFTALEAYCAGEIDDPLIDIRFHTAILRASENRMISGLQPVIEHLMQTSLSITTSPITDSIVERALRLHRDVVEAIERREPEAAETAMKAVIEQTYAALPARVTAAGRQKVASPR